MSKSTLCRDVPTLLSFLSFTCQSRFVHVFDRLDWVYYFQSYPISIHSMKEWSMLQEIWRIHEIQKLGEFRLAWKMTHLELADIAQWFISTPHVHGHTLEMAFEWRGNSLFKAMEVMERFEKKKATIHVRKRFSLIILVNLFSNISNLTLVIPNGRMELNHDPTSRFGREVVFYTSLKIHPSLIVTSSPVYCPNDPLHLHLEKVELVEEYSHA